MNLGARSAGMSFGDRVAEHWARGRSATRPLESVIAAIPDFTLELSVPEGLAIDDLRGRVLPVAAMRYDLDDADIDQLCGHLPGGETQDITVDCPDPYILLSRNDRMDYLEIPDVHRVLADPSSKIYLSGASMKDTEEFGSAPEIWLIVGSSSVYDPATSRILTRKNLVDFNKKNRWWECRIDLFKWGSSAPEGAAIAMWFEDDPDWWWTEVQDLTIGFSLKNVSGEFSYELAEKQDGAKVIRSNDDYMGDAVLYYDDQLPASYSTGNVSFETNL
jgi:hypothetical protein